MSGEVLIRSAFDGDLDAIANIYAHYVLNGTATFEVEPPARDEIGRRRRELTRAGFPWLVAEREGKVLGYAYASLYRTRAAYRFTLEDSIYVDPGHTGQGIGSLLLPALIDHCQYRGCRQLIAVIGGIDNRGSVRLHETFGFRHVGVLKEVGWKFGQWVDCILMQKTLRTAGSDYVS